MLDRYCGQIFCEMLGQCCYPEYFKNEEECQKVPALSDQAHSQPFVIHCVHTTVTIYVAKLPNLYLARIAHDGADYATKHSERVNLQRTRKYHLRNPNEFEELFVVMVHLVWNLLSGNVHVGPLFKHPENPLLSELVISLTRIG